MHEIIHITFSLFLLQIFNNPFVVLPLAFIGHFVLDVIPHYKPSSKRRTLETVIDVTLAVLLLFFYLVFGNYNLPLWLILATVFVGAFPDFFLLLNMVWKIKIWKPFMLDFHTKIQHEYAWGWIIELILLSAIILCLIYL